MKDRPILFQGAMVRALLEGRKTQTRRALKVQPTSSTVSWGCIGGQGFGFIFGESDRVVNCPYGAPEDRLWVRETWSRIHPGLLQHLDPDPMSPEWRIVYRADGEQEPALSDYGEKWHPSIHMFRQDSRITLKLVSVRVERLWQISEADAIAEGAMRNDAPGEEWDGTYLTQRYIDGVEGAQDDEPHGSAREWYREVWEGISGPGSWALNPWVWVLEFERA